ncbi:unnamed protein product [Cladocopium goreaui]|uniref:Isocitrate dehydrogenase [NADP] n=1 Tax=Cladocopium goreaui TaxID=2562237 RepID=A0A9P1CU61_9DINO|nr:unnamed protein product [Cladocopium goreaui]
MSGAPITMTDGKLSVPDEPIIPFIEGDGTGPDIWAASQLVLDAAVEKAYGGAKKIAWTEVLAGQKAFDQTGEWLPEATLDSFRKHLVGIKGPLTTPVGGGIRSINVALRQILDLYTCLRPVQYFTGVPSPVTRPELTDMVIFRENTEDIYAGVEFAGGTDEAKKVLDFLESDFPERFAKIRFGTADKAAAWREAVGHGADPSLECGIGIKPVSKQGTQRLVHSAIQYAIDNDRDSVTLVHKGNIMKFTEGAFRDWGYELAAQAFDAEPLDGGPWHVIKKGQHGAKQDIVVKDVIADAMLQQILTRPAEYSVIATLNLNGDYISDALAACVGGIGIAPGGNINYVTGHAIFEATHGTAPKYAGQDKVNPGSVILSGEMMLRHLGWTEAADLIVKGLNGAIGAKTVTYDFERLMDGATLVKCSEFGAAIVKHMGLTSHLGGRGRCEAAPPVNRQRDIYLLITGEALGTGASLYEACDEVGVDPDFVGNFANRCSQVPDFEGVMAARDGLDAVVPIFCQEDDGPMKQVASAVLLALGDELFLLTAAHVVDEWQGGSHLLMPAADHIRSIGGDLGYTPLPPGGNREEDKVDIAYLRLDSAWKEMLHKDAKPLGKQALLLTDNDPPGALHTFAGYPWRLTDQTEEGFAGDRTTYTGHLYAPDVFETLGYSPVAHVLVRVRRRKTYSTRYGGRRAAGHPEGISGGAVFSWPPTVAQRASDQPLRLAAIGHTYHAKEHCLAGTRVISLIMAIIDRFPELAKCFDDVEVACDEFFDFLQKHSVGCINRAASVLVGMPWYTHDTYAQCVRDFDDGESMPDTFEAWLHAALESEKSVYASGSAVWRAHVRPGTIRPWCAARGIERVDGKARRGWRQSRWSTQRWTRSYNAPSRTVYARSSTDPVWPSSVRRSYNPITYSGISRAEQNAQRRRDAWYEEAYNGWRATARSRGRQPPESDVAQHQAPEGRQRFRTPVAVAPPGLLPWRGRHRPGARAPGYALSPLRGFLRRGNRTRWAFSTLMWEVTAPAESALGKSRRRPCRPAAFVLDEPSTEATRPRGTGLSKRTRLTMLRTFFLAAAATVCATAAHAGRFYDFVETGTGDTIAHLWLTELPASQDEVVELRFTPKGQALFGFGDVYPKPLENTAISLAYDDGMGGLGPTDDGEPWMLPAIFDENPADSTIVDVPVYPIFRVGYRNAAGMDELRFKWSDSITGHGSVSVLGDWVQTTPEPSGGVLAAIGLAAAARGRRRRAVASGA